MFPDFLVESNINLQTATYRQQWQWLLERQYGFFRAHSTLDEIIILINLVRDAINLGGWSVSFMLDPKNVLNFANWCQIKVGIPRYMATLVDNYPFDCVVCESC